MNGWIILDKDTGLFSRTAGGRVARIFGTKKFGHIGTLDAMATGVLPIAIGNATKMIPFVEDAHSHEKEYLFGVQFGFETDTLDITGRITARGGALPNASDIERVIPNFIGNVMQTPPQFSAVHVNGTRAYDIARRGGCADIAPREITIYLLNLVGRCGQSWQFRTRCSRGTYVRSIARDIGKMCGTYATVDMIRRTETNGFTLKDAVKLDFLENLVNNDGDIRQYLMPMDFGLGDIPVLNLADKDADLYVHGGFIETAANNGLHRVYNGDGFIGIGTVDCGILRPKRTI